VRFFYDTEFLEDGRTIDLISIGIVGEDGSEYYAVNRRAPWGRIRKNPWLMENVWPHLPRYQGDARMFYGDKLDYHSGLFRTPIQIRDGVEMFLLGPKDSPVRDVELWAWYSAYDHVALAQLWGRMGQIPRGVPWWTNDLQQLAGGRDLEQLVPRSGGEHHALADARWNRQAYLALQ
jgi:hypothetical protein